MIENLLVQLRDALKALLAALMAPKPPIIVQDESKPVIPTPAPQPKQTPPAPKYAWGSTTEIRHSVRVICDEEKLTLEQKNTMTATIQAESGFKLKAVNYNRDKKTGRVLSADWGLCQWNDYWHGKEISPAEAVGNPEKAVRLMCAYWKRGQRDQWIAYKTGAYKKFL